MNPFLGKDPDTMTEEELLMRREKHYSFWLSNERKVSVFLAPDEIDRITADEACKLFARDSIADWSETLRQESVNDCKYIIVDCTGASDELQRKAIPLAKDKYFQELSFEKQKIIVTASDINELNNELRGCLVIVRDDL